MKVQTFHQLSDEELDQIESRIEAATVGPWLSYVTGRDPGAGSSCIELGWCNELGSFKCIELIGATTADQDFIASARQDLPRLLLEVRALRSCLEALRAVDRSDELQQRGGVGDAPAPLLSFST